MNKFNILLFLLIGLAVGISLWGNRWVFSYKYDVEYFEHYYHRSQWHIPESSRSISDSDLYKYVGYRLAGGENPFNINFEVPPAVKFLYGLSSKYLGNPYWVSIIFYFVSLLLVGLMGLQIIRNKTAALVASAFFAVQPFIAAQIGQTMLDLPMTVFLTGHILFVLRGVEKRKILYLVVGGILLGLAAGTKIGIYSVLIGLASLVYIFIKLRQIKWVTIFSISALAGYFLAFVNYFMYHQNPLPWIRLHKQVVSFYLNSDVNPNLLNEYLTIFIGKFNGWWENGADINVSEWTLLLPLGFLSFLFTKTKSKYFFAIGAIILLVNTFVPFYPRYLILLLPILSVSLATFIYKHKLLTVVLVLVGIKYLVPSLFPIEADTVIQLNKMAQTRNYHDLYKQTNAITQKSISRQDFVDSLEERDIVLTDPVMISENNQWRLVWDERYVTPKKIVSFENPTIAVIPEKIGNWQQTLLALEAVNGLSMNENWRRIKQVVPDKYPVAVSEIPDYGSLEKLDALIQLPGVVILKD